MTPSIQAQPIKSRREAPRESEHKMQANESQRTTGDREIYPGQWRLSRIEVYNWGTFNGHHIIPISRRGSLLTGKSGSGKSTLLDAVTTVLTPPRKRHLNAAARSGSERGEDRTIASYVRGAWGNRTSDSGEVTSAFLRPRGAVWSGILLRFENGDASRRPISLAALFHLKAAATSSNDVSSLFGVIRDEADLAALSPYAANGIDLAKFNRDFKDGSKGFRAHGPFASYFTKLLAMRDLKSLELLHRTQAAKNFGSLDDLLRRFMLEEPKSFTQAEKAVDQFSALDEAYRKVVDQRKQMECLAPLETLENRYVHATDALLRSERLSRVLNGFTDSLALDRLNCDKEARLRKLDGLKGEKLRLGCERDLAEIALDQAQQALSDGGGSALDSAFLSMANEKEHLRSVLADRSRLETDLMRCGLGAVPSDAAQWGRLVRRVQMEATASRNSAKEQREQAYEAARQFKEQQNRLSGIEAERRHLLQTRTNIPRGLDDVRQKLATKLGLDRNDLIFVGELVDIKEDQQEWRGAAERLLASQGRVLLVADRYAKLVASALDDEHLGLRFEFEAVPEEVEVPVIHCTKDSLIQKLIVGESPKHPEYVHWINRLLRTSFDYTCVRDANDLHGHRLAVTLRGQIKRNRRYIKDDRSKLNDRGRWILGFSNDGKIAELEAQAGRLRNQLSELRRTADEQADAMHRTHDLERLEEILSQADWNAYDVDFAKDALERAEAHYETLKEANGKLAPLEKARDEARRRFEDARDAQSEITALEKEAQRAIAEIDSRIETARHRLQGADLPDGKDSEELRKRFADQGLDAKSDAADLYRISNDVSTELAEEQRGLSTERDGAQGSIERIIADYRRDWGAECAQLAADFEERNSYLAILRRVRSSGLPAHEKDFLKVLHDFSQDQITALSVTIRDAVHEVKERIAQVNSSLALSEYAPGIHLEIVVRESRGAQAEAFLKDLRGITEGSWNDEELAQAEERYRKSAAVINRIRAGLSRDSAAERSWLEQCLDTRTHVSFMAREIDSAGEIRTVHASDRGLSGGQKQKLVIFCLAAALRYQLAEDGADIPSFGTVTMDEAFDKADTGFAETAMSTFEDFGFQLVLATPDKMVQVAESHVGSYVCFHCEEGKQSSTISIAAEKDDDPDDESQEAKL
ncbi:ATP-binding protein [Adlercreutzia equolifaciens]|uniref:ATP-binding protein n=1 Tax=Adlercreutzia equolifaciens TaxID=446660 RepID=UPI0022E77282|nr:ATP-binding protein [Adlercreutzia equolifaciens]